MRAIFAGVTCLALLLPGCGPSRRALPNEADAGARFPEPAASSSVTAPSASVAKPPAEAARPPEHTAKKPRLESLGVAITRIHTEPRFAWRQVQELNWQGVAEPLPRLPAELPRDPKGCGDGMLLVAGGFLVDESGRLDTDRVQSLQNESCTLWRTADHGLEGLCDRFDRERWVASTSRLSRKPLHFCIDRYEFPNAHGEFPLVVVTYSEARAYCGKVRKRLCTESEWTFACEGEEGMPYPYGYERDPTACPIGILGPGPEKDMFVPRTTAQTARGIDRSWRGKR